MARASEEQDTGEASTGAETTERGERSGTKYPYFDLQDAEQFARRVLTTGGNEVLEDDLLKALDLSRTTKSWIYRLSTAREFGLLDRHGRKDEAKIKLTDLARRLLRPGDEAERAASLVAAFRSPGLYQKLSERYRDAPLPAVEFLGNVLVREHQLVTSVARQAAEAFISSAKYAGLVHPNTGALTESPATEGPRPEPVLPKKEEPRSDGEQQITIPETFIPHVFQLRAKLKVIIPLPPDLTSKDVTRLHRWMETLPIEEEEQQ